MSLILEALKKLDREKQAPDRGVLVVGPSAWPSARDRRSTVVATTVVVSAVALAGAGAMLWLLQRPMPADVAAQPAGTAVAPTTGPAQVAPLSSEAAALPRATARSSTGGAAGAPGPVAPAGRPSTSMSQPAAAPLAGRPDPEEPSTDPETAPARTTNEATSAEATITRRAAPSKTPRPPSGSQDPQLHAISSQNGQPVAVLNGHLVREGDTIDGMRVVRIGADEVEIEIGGRRRVVKF